jgi:hypothetical protein
VKTQLLRGLIIAVCVVTFSACSSTPVTMNEEVDRADIDMTKGRMIRAQAAGFQLMLVIPIMVNSRQARAWEQLKQEGGNDYISGVTITERWTYGFVGTAYTTIIEAMAYPRIRKTDRSPVIGSNDDILGSERALRTRIEQEGVGSERRVRAYILRNHRYLTTDISKGQGEFLSSFCSLLRLPESGETVKKLRAISARNPGATSFAEAIVSQYQVGEQPAMSQPTQRMDGSQKSGPCQKTDRGLICRGESDYDLH